MGVIAQPDFPLSVPPHYLSLIRRGDLADPLLLQVLARGEEALPQPGRLTQRMQVHEKTAWMLRANLG